MEKFGGVLNLNCEYRDGNDVFGWSANVLAEIPFNSKVENNYSIEGSFKFNNHNAYILGISGLCNNLLSFILLTYDNNIIEYCLLFDAYSNSYYGVWHNITKSSGGFTKIDIKEQNIPLYRMNKKIEKYGHNMFYPKYSNIVSQLLLTKKSTINDMEYDELLELYRYSKNYFNTERVVTSKKLVKKNVV